MTRHALFFRGVNVGKRRIAMADLRDMLRGLGGDDVQTVLQSGTAVISHPEEGAKEIERLVEAAFASRFGFESWTHARGRADLDQVVARNPFPEFAGEHPDHLLVSFGRDEFDLTAVEAVQSQVTGPERLAAVARELYVVFPDGIGTSTLPRVKGYTKLIGQATARNWNTVVKVRDAL